MQISIHFGQSDCLLTTFAQDKSGGLCLALQISIQFVQSDCIVTVITQDLSGCCV